MTPRIRKRNSSVVRIDGMNSVLRSGAKVVLCGLLLTAVGCAVDDHQQAPAPVSVYVPSEAVAAPAPLTPDPSPATGRGEQVALTPSPSPGNGRGEIVALTPGPSPDSGRGEIVVAYVSAEGGAIPEPVVAPAPLPPTTRGAEESPAETGGRTEVHPTPEDVPAAETGGRTEVHPTAEGAMTLEQAMAETLQSDPKLRGAMETIRQAQGDFVTSSLLPNPTVQVNGVFLPLRPFTPDRPAGPPELDVIGTFPIDWYLFGKRAAAMTNAQIGVAVSNADYCDQVRQRLANTAAAFYDVLEAQSMLKLAEEDLASLKRVESITLAGVKFGGAGTIEAERIRLSVLDAQREACTRETTLTTKKAQLRAAVGRVRQTPRFDVAGSLEIAKPAAPLSLSEAIAVAERNRPDIVSLRRQVAKARSGVEVERTKARPTVSPSLGYQYQYQYCNGVADASSYTAQMNVSVPIFDRNQGNIAKAESALVQSHFNLQAQLVQAEADVEQAVAEFHDAEEEAVLIGPQQLATARSVRDRTISAYKLGGMKLLDVLDAERAYRDTHRTYILGQSGYWHALHKLNAALGQQVLQ